MAAVARLPQGALVLPGFDASLPAAVWQRLGDDDPGAADHPQHGFRALADALGFDPAAVSAWHPAPPPAPARNALVSLALRPAPVTDQWLTEGAALAGSLAPACASLTWVEAPDQRAEALAIALALREAAETGTRAALVTPDRQLARRVTAELDRWALIPDDSAGRPLALTPPGVLLRRLAALPGAAPHPRGPPRPPQAPPHRQRPRRPLRPPPPHRPPGDAGASAAAPPGSTGPTSPPGPDRGRRRSPRLDRLAPRHARPPRRPTPPPPSTRTSPATAPPPRPWPPAPTRRPTHALWEQEAGAQARALLDALAAEAAAAAPLDARAYRALLQSQMAARDVPEPAVTTHPGLAIWGTLEARVQSADLVILGGLNEGTWPRLPAADPWLGRGLRRAIGLPSPDRRIGLSAHDFQQAMGAPRVILTRATRDAEAPTVASRWLLRLENLLLGLGPEGQDALAAAKARGQRLAADAARLDLPAARVPPARPPRPAPARPPPARPSSPSPRSSGWSATPTASTPARSSASAASTRPAASPTRWPAAPPSTPRSTTSSPPPKPASPKTPPRVFLAIIADARSAAAAPWPAVNAIWTARLARAAPWFLAGEAERRARGTPAAREVKGRREVEGLARPFAITARADRIDRAARRRRHLRLQVRQPAPPPAEARAFHLQLPLEAAIAEAGGFEGVPAGPRAPPRAPEVRQDQGAGHPAPRHRPRRPRRNLGRASSPSSPTTWTRRTASPPASARRS